MWISSMLVGQWRDAYVVHILLVLAARVAHQHDIQNTDADHRRIDGLVLGNVRISKGIIPIGRCRQHDETTGESGQMRGEALCLIVIG